MQMTDLASNPDLKVVAFVHAKGTSERLPGKNLRVLGDRPLICHAIANALASDLVDLVVIDSDSDTILRVGQGAGAIPLRRPAELATNETTGDNLLFWQSTQAPSSEIIVQVVPTCPFTTHRSIDMAVARAGLVNSVIGMRRERRYCWHDGAPQYHNWTKHSSKHLEPSEFETTGLYAIRTEFASRAQGRIDKANCGAVWMSAIEAIDINMEEDFQFAEIVWKGLQC